MHSTNNLADGYLGSGKILRLHLAKYGRDKFHKEILTFADTRTMLEAYEKDLITETTLSDPLCMNRSPGGRGGSRKGHVKMKKRTHSEETREKMSRARTNNPKNKGWQLSPESRERQKVAVQLALTGVPKQKVVCPHCNQMGGKAAMQRWHFEKCKEK